MSARAVVIGAGVGGLAAAARLAAAGLEVLVLERAGRPGGKMREVPVGGVPFDAGPSVLTMPWVFDELFQDVGERRQDAVAFDPLEPACRHFFQGGLVLDLYNDDPAEREPWARSAEAIGRALGQGAKEDYRRYRRQALALYQAVEGPFLRRALPRTPLGLLLTHRARDALAFLRLDARRTVWEALGRQFRDEPLRVLFSRYATYCGSDPFRAPATLAVIPHVELGFGVHAVRGGMQRLAEALASLAERKGVRLCYGADVERVELAGRRAWAVRAGGERVQADVIVANCDVAQLYGRLLADTPVGRAGAARLRRLEPSLSAHLRLVLARRTAAPLSHHNVFFSPDYAREFVELRLAVPTEPTVYLCASEAPGGEYERWFFLVNAPPLSPGAEVPPQEAAEEAGRVRAAIARRLRAAGVDLERAAVAEEPVVPADFAARFPHSRGSLYGSASNGLMSAFVRPRNRAAGLDNVYCVGGSTHPGAGVPMAALSARIACALLLRERSGWQRVGQDSAVD